MGNLSSDTYQFTISTANGCEEIIDIFIDTDGNAVTPADAGEDVETCETSIALSANNPIVGELGVWTIASGQGNISSSTDSDIIVSNLAFGENIFVWTLENECGSSSDEVVITVIDGNPTINNPGFVSCLEEIPLSVNIANGEGDRFFGWTHTYSVTM